MEDYQEAIKSAEVVLVEFYADWCPHCQKMAPIMEKIKKEFAGTVPVLQYNVDNYEKLSDEYGADVIPTFILYKNGEEVWRHVAEIPYEVLAGKIKEQFAKGY